ncbi:MAG TPA: response regulator [Nitrospinaceae bacterium]|nr:response regulator [Nitrospinaceae bacterium]
MTSRLLVADDSITIQKIISMAFATEDVEVEGFVDGQEAFDRIVEFNPDIVLADVDMPGLDGFELSSKIKQSSETNSIKVLLLSSELEDFDEQRYQKCGADNHISKPFKSGDIVALVKSLLDSSSSSDEIVLQPGDDLLEVREPVEFTDPETLSDLDAPEPSLEDLLASVEKLSNEGVSTPNAEEEDLSFEKNPDSEEIQEPEGALYYAGEQEIFAEVRQRKLDNMEDLDSSFKEIVRAGGPAHQKEIADTTELSSMGGIIPEPKDLLECIAPGTFSEVGKRPLTSEDVKGSLDYISDLSDQSGEMNSLQENFCSDNLGHDSENNLFAQTIADKVNPLLQRSLGSALEKEVSGLSDVILQTIREVVREVMPEIARQVIREEIEKIKKRDMF